MACKEVAFAYCKTEDMKADILTKALAPRKFKKCKSELGIAYVVSVWGSVEIQERRRMESNTGSLEAQIGDWALETSTVVRR